DVSEGSSLLRSPVFPEAFAWDAAQAALTIGQEVKIGVQDLQEKFGAVATAIKDHGQASLADEGAHFRQNGRKHFDQTSIGLGGDHEQWVAALVIEPVIRSGRHRQAHPGDMSLGQAMLPVVNADVPVEV